MWLSCCIRIGREDRIRFQYSKHIGWRGAQIASGANPESSSSAKIASDAILSSKNNEDAAKYTRPGSNWRPSACEADVIATRPLVPLRCDNPFKRYGIPRATLPPNTIRKGFLHAERTSACKKVALDFGSEALLGMVTLAFSFARSKS